MAQTEVKDSEREAPGRLPYPWEPDYRFPTEFGREVFWAEHKRRLKVIWVTPLLFLTSPLILLVLVLKAAFSARHSRSFASQVATDIGRIMTWLRGHSRKRASAQNTDHIYEPSSYVAAVTDTLQDAKRDSEFPGSIISPEEFDQLTVDNKYFRSQREQSRLTEDEYASTTGQADYRESEYRETRTKNVLWVISAGSWLVASVLFLIFGVTASSLRFWLTLALLGVAAFLVASMYFAFLSGELRHRLRRPVAALAIAISMLAVLVAIPVSDIYGPTSPSPTPVTTAPTSPSDVRILFDDFSGPDLNDKWTLTSTDGSDPQAQQQIYSRDGKLNLVVSPTNSPSGANATLTPRLPNRVIKEISLKMSLVSQTGPSDGAAYLILSNRLGRENRLWMGPDADAKPTLGYYICENEKSLCHNRAEATTDQQYLVEKGLDYNVVASVDQAGSLQFNVTENFSASAPNFGPITQFRFYLFSDPKRNFHVTVDDVWITYSE